MLKRKPEEGDLVTSAEAFGQLVKDIRETTGMSQDKVAIQVPCDRSQIARVELGTRVPHGDLILAVDRILDTGGLLLRLWSKINWYPVIEHPDWFKRRARMDAEALALRVYQAALVPGLLQTEDYIEALFKLADLDGEGSVRERVAARWSRQLRWVSPDGPLLVVVLDESCIRRVVGSRAIMREQCRRLLALGQQPNIIIQVLPFNGVSVDRPNVSMSLITLPDGDQWVYSESLDRGHFSDDPAVLAKHARTYDVLRAAALSASDSAALIREALEGYADDEQPRSERSDLGQEQLQREQRRRLCRGRRGPRLYGRRPRP
jgi:transcriptional regulator with XRE-family HTH domain